jgi:tryptophan synthase beta chain
MKFNNVDFDTYFKNYPDAKGYFGNYGGSYIPPPPSPSCKPP